MDSFEKSKKDLKSYIDGQRACGIFLFIFRQDKWCTKDRGKFQEFINFNEGAIALHVANWLLKKMEVENV